MAIDRTGISSLDAGASDITYTGNQGPKSPDQQLMASADPMLVEEYNKYVFEMEEQGLQPMSFRQFMEQAMSSMAQGGRAGYQSGELVAPPGISQEEWERIMFGPKGPRPLSSQSPYLSVHAYGGTARPTYTQKRKQNLAYGGIAGVDGRKRYGVGSWFQGVKDKFVDDIIPNEIKDNPMLTAAITGGLLNQFGVPFTGTPGDRMGQNWLGELLSKVPGTGDQTIDMVLGGDRGNQIGLGQGIENVGASIGDFMKAQFPSSSDGGGTTDGKGGLLKTIGGGIKKGIETLVPGGETGYGNIYGTMGNLLGLGQDQQYDTQGNRKINWQTPLAIGTAAGIAQSQMPKDIMPQDTSGIDIANVRSRALTGSDPDLHFLPQASATTAYANGGRTGYYAGDRVGQGAEQNMVVSFSNYKNSGGIKDFREWFSDVYLPEAHEATPAMGEKIVSSDSSFRPGVQSEPLDIENWLTPGLEPTDIESWRFRKAQGGRIGYQNGGDYEAKIKELMAKGLSRELAEILAKTDPEIYEVMDKAQGGRIGAQEGGLMDLGGMEKDYRNDGGFVPIGGQERADDVPARLSKNEFVFTADAVRAAGGGDIDQGAEVMENLMENLEQGGQVSEESQGLEGARDMFATAQRLEGVM